MGGNTFQTIIIGLFAFFTILGFLAFSGVLPFFGPKSNVPRGVGGTVVVWGVLPRGALDGSLEAINKKNEDIYTIQYQEVRSDEFDRLLVESLASGKGPDVILLPQDLILRHKDKIAPIGYDSLSARDFLDTYVEEGELYLRASGILALPFSLDPMVMFWNRDLFSSAGISKPPATWEELPALSEKLTETDQAFNIKKSTIAFGEFRNVTHAKDILAMLIMQAGNPIVSIVSGIEKDLTKDIFTPMLKTESSSGLSPAESSLRFFTEFSNPAKRTYSWNRALPQSRDFFIEGDLALYFGFAGEMPSIQARSPHLNFDVAPVPQLKGVARKTTFGRMTGAAVLKTSKNRTTSFWAVYELAGEDFMKLFAFESGLPPTRRSLLADKPTDAYRRAFYDSALFARAWHDPDPQATNTIFQSMVETVVSGRSELTSAVSRADRELADLIRN